MRILLDENFPLGLLRGLRDDGFEADHIITLDWRGASDTRIRERLQDAEVLSSRRTRTSSSERQSQRPSSSRG